ncbi:hypothetical protein FTV88_2671 [Heliorestis convoluta]|uniref:DUF3593 domain-containing protein n=2 Tax=Heliorestis convoluta TaxID=356322 RepID=A0A5Q2N0E4_9FIRM|nr:hypothetical protein FTV88_2671 [Heliorestis convoluta]
MADLVMTLSIIPYFFFLYCIYKIYKLDKSLINKTTVVGFFSLIGFVFFTAGAGYYAVMILGEPGLGHIDWLHGLSEFGLTITNFIIVLGLKRHLDRL